MTIRRESWESYVTFLRGLYKPSAILDQHAGRVRGIVQARKGIVRRSTAADTVGATARRVFFNGGRLPPERRRCSRSTMGRIGNIRMKSWPS